MVKNEERHCNDAQNTKLPQCGYATSWRRAITHEDSNNLTVININRQLDPLLVRFRTNKRPHLVELNGQPTQFFGVTSMVLGVWSNF
jgi:hypothetical protein